MRWPNENAFNAEIESAVAATGRVVTVPLVKAIIGAESGFVPTAYRAEVKINDASRGLMQVLYKTALGTGWQGTPEELFKPAVNVLVGTTFLSLLAKSHKGDLAAAISAYNNGNGRRATEPTTVCLARDSTGKCIRSFTALPGQFLNQPYVDKVLANLRYFDAGVPTTPEGAGLITLVVLGGALYLAYRAKKA